jgi:membrane fusion protein (multidrug efflux system)
MNYKSIIIFAMALSLVACNNEKKEETKKEGGMPAMGMGMGMMNPMETVEISKTNPLVMLKLAGELKPDQQTELFAKVNSYVKSIRVDIGDKFRQGKYW